MTQGQGHEVLFLGCIYIKGDFDISVGHPRLQNQTTLQFSINGAFVAAPISVDVLVLFSDPLFINHKRHVRLFPEF